MDTSRTYINMVNCPEIQEYANNKRVGYPPSHPDVGDMVFIHEQTRDICAFVTNTNGSNRYGHSMIGFGDWEAVEVFVPCAQEWFALASVIWLPRQDQLQDMIGYSEPYRLFNALYAFGEQTGNEHSPEELTLKYLMKWKYDKRWDGESWVLRDKKGDD